MHSPAVRGFTAASVPDCRSNQRTKDLRPPAVAPALMAVVTPAPVVVALQPVYVAPTVPPVAYEKPGIDIVVPIRID